jgi:hypothetical protein
VVQREGTRLYPGGPEGSARGQPPSPHSVATPSDLLWWLSKPEQQRTSGYRPPVRLTLRGLDHFQERLLAVLGPRDRASVAGRLDPRPVTTGKRSGSCVARVLIDSAEVGAVPAVDLEGEPRVGRALRPGPVDCQVDLVRYPERVWAAVITG